MSHSVSSKIESIAIKTCAEIPQLTAVVVPAPTFASPCSLSGTGQRVSTAGSSASFSLTAFNRFHNLRRVGGDAFEMFLLASHMAIVLVSVFRDGTFCTGGSIFQAHRH